MTKVAINGFGRTGRAAAKIILEKYPELNLAAVNDLAEPAVLAHIFKHDTVYGTYKKEAAAKGEELIIGDKKISLFSKRDPEELPWKEMGIDIVLECTGFFEDYEGAVKHVKAGARKVVISAPSKDPEKIPSYIIGANEEKMAQDERHVIDMGSCTTNCLAPILRILDDAYEVKKGFMTTIHSYTSSQNLVDVVHSDLRRARAAAENIIPTTTGAAKAIGRVLPGLNGKMDGMAFRVPLPAVSVLDLFCELGKEVTADEVMNLFKDKSGEEKYDGILKIESAPLVSSDYIGSRYSAVVDVPFLMANGNLVKVVAWYDNEWSYSHRLADIAALIAKNWKMKEKSR